MKKWIYRPAEIITIEWDIEVSPQKSQIVASSILDTRSREYQSFIEGVIANFSIAGYKLHTSSDYTHSSNRKNSQSEYYTFVKVDNSVIVQVIVHVRISDHFVESDLDNEKRQRCVDKISREIVKEYKSLNKRPLSIPVNIVFNDETGIESYEEALVVIRKAIVSLDKQLKLRRNDEKMKKWIHNSTSIEGGVRPENKLFYIDYTYNAPEDIIDIVQPQLYMHIHDNKCYTFGYKFNENASSVDRTRFIQAVKQIGDNPLTDSQLEQFIKRPFMYVEQLVNLYKIECLVYPGSQRSPLVKKMIRCINDMTSHDMEGATFELVKAAPTNIQFDFKSFERDFGDSQGYKQMLEYVNSVLMPKLRDLDYFSIAHNVKSKYRPYIKGFLNFHNEEDIDKFSRLQGSNILIIDDINTTGATLNEILRKLGEINSNCTLYIYTLIGK